MVRASGFKSRHSQESWEKSAPSRSPTHYVEKLYLNLKERGGRERERGCLATKLRRLVSLRMREQIGAVLFCACVGGSLRTSPPLPPAGGGGMAVARATGIQYGGRILTLSSQGPPALVHEPEAASGKQKAGTTVSSLFGPGPTSDCRRHPRSG